MHLWYDSNLVLIQSTLVYFLLALSIQMVLKVGVFSVAGVGFFAVGAYGAGILSLHHFPTSVAIILPVIACTALAYLMSLPLTRLRGMYLALVTVAFDLIIGVFATNGGSLTGGATGLFGIPGKITVLWALVIVVAVIILASQFESRNIGRGFEAIRANEDMARSLGINITHQRNLVFALSGGLGALAGAIQVFFLSVITPGQVTFSLITLVLTMVVVGGMDSWMGVAVGAILFTWLPDTLQSIGQWRQVVYGGVVVIVAMYAPAGIVGYVRRIIRALATRRQTSIARAKLFASENSSVSESAL